MIVTLKIFLVFCQKRFFIFLVSWQKTIIIIHVELRLRSQSFFKGSEFSSSEVSRSEFSRTRNFRTLEKWSASDELGWKSLADHVLDNRKRIIKMHDIDCCTVLGVQVFFCYITRKWNNFAVSLIIFVHVVFVLVLNKNAENRLPVFNYQGGIVAWFDTWALVTTIVIHVELPLKFQSFFKGSELSRSEFSRSEVWSFEVSVFETPVFSLWDISKPDIETFIEQANLHHPTV